MGRDLALSELRRHYDVVVVASGASEDRLLGLIHEERHQQVMSARAFVGWYNGSPEHRDIHPPLEDCESVAVIGHGNVALDVARVLLTPTSALATTDISEAALRMLRRSRVRRVHLIGRRGPVQVSFSSKEFREMLNLPGCQPCLDLQFLDRQLQLPEVQALLQKDRPKRRLMSLLREAAVLSAKADRTQDFKEWHVHFLLSPGQLIFEKGQECAGSAVDGPGKLVGLRLNENTLHGDVAVATDKTVDIQCQLVIRSIGYKAVRIDDELPFDPKSGVVPNIAGRVVRDESTV